MIRAGSSEQCIDQLWGGKNDMRPARECCTTVGLVKTVVVGKRPFTEDIKLNHRQELLAADLVRLFYRCFRISVCLL